MTVEYQRPQPGPQAEFLACPADIAVYGGAAGGGKSWALLLDQLRGASDPHFRGVLFRRIIPNITNQGGLLDESRRVFGRHGQLVTSPRIEWRFESGAVVQLTHLQHEHTVENHKGAQYTAAGFDELTEFTEDQFFYLLSRMRSPQSSFRPWVRATTNPDANSWVRRLLDWWIDDEGYAIPSRSGVIRWMRRDEGGALEWFDAETPGCLSFTFISASLDDNAMLTASDPDYRARLELLTRVEREKLLGGNWNITSARGIFEHHQIDPRRAVYEGLIPAGTRWVRYWDLADTEPHERNPEPDWTVGALVGLHSGEDGDELYIKDVRRFRLSGSAKRAEIQRVALGDGLHVTQAVEQEPGSTGKEVARDYIVRLFAGLHAVADRPSGSKTVRASRWLPLAETGRVRIVRDGARLPEWAEGFVLRLEQFPHGKRDEVDAISGAYAVLKGRHVVPSMYDDEPRHQPGSRPSREIPRMF